MNRNVLPYKLLTWQDDQTDAQGWLIIHRLVNGVSGGGLFMHPDATVEEVADLAATMSLKNTIQEPQFGGGKGGIRFDPKSPEATGVLRRFMLAHREVIEREWSTGADLYTSGEVIEKIAREDLKLPSAFVAMARTLGQHAGIPSQVDHMAERMNSRWNEHFSAEEASTGHSVAEAIRWVTTGRPRVAIQGFGSVGSSTAHFLTASDIGDVVGICELDGFLTSPDGIEVDELLRRRLKDPAAPLSTLARTDPPTGWRWVPRRDGQSEEELLTEFISEVQPDVISPCAKRYVLTEPVLRAFVGGGGRYVVCGANNAFASEEIRTKYSSEGVTILPEWVSNSGAALLFAETLKTDRWDDRSVERIFTTITRRIHRFLEKRQEENSRAEKKHPSPGLSTAEVNS